MKNKLLKDVVKVFMRFEGNVNFEWRVTTKDGEERYFTSMDNEVPWETFIEEDRDAKISNDYSEDTLGNLLWSLTEIPPRTEEDINSEDGDEWTLLFKNGELIKVFKDL